MKRLVLASVLAAALAASAQARDDAAADAAAAAPPSADQGADAAAPQASAEEQAFLSSLHFQEGNVAVPAADVHLDLGSDFRYLDRADADKVLEQYWHNPHDDDVLGMIVPAKLPLSDEHSWAVVLTKSDDGHVSDDDAAKTDYDELLKNMQEATLAQNEARKKAGFSEMTLVGWAAPPRYDAASKKLYWAKELSAVGAPQHTLNYDIRVLGRTGYLSMVAVAGMNDLHAVETGMQQLLPRVAFDPGKRYADFDSSHDKLAAYGVAALVAGGIAAKAGLFAKIGIALLALKKFVIIGVIAVVAFVRKLFGGKGKGGGPTVQ